jgi:DNA-directed RNA polymerase subunit RPC12/RpoP
MAKKELQFKCPKCGSTILEEVMVNVTVMSQVCRIVQVDDEAVVENYEKDPTLEDGEVERYQCLHCGDVLRDNSGYDVSDTDELLEWFHIHL